MDPLNIVDGYKHKKLNIFDKALMELFYKANAFNRGKLAVAFPEYYKAYTLLKIEK